MASPRRPRAYNIAAGSLLAVLVGVLAWWAYGLAIDTAELRAGQVALEAEDNEKAYKHLSRAAKSWPNSGEVLYLAARAARVAGEPGEAIRLLERAAKNQWPEEAIDLERALQRTQTATASSREEAFLFTCVEKGHPDTAYIVAALVPALLRQFMIPQADFCLERWLELRSESPSAWFAKGVLAERRRNRSQAEEAYSEVVRLRPDHLAARSALVRLLLERNKPAEAKPHVEALLARRPVSAEAYFFAAELALLNGSAGEAEEALSRLFRVEPEHAGGRHLAGKIHHAAGRTAEARKELDRAAAAAPADKEILYTRLIVVKAGGVQEEIKEANDRLERVGADLTRLADLTKKIAERPEDADLRFAVAEIHLRNGQDREGLRWAENALSVKAEHRATHRLLADYYAKKGDAARAAVHRLAAEAADARSSPPTR